MLTPSIQNITNKANKTHQKNTQFRSRYFIIIGISLLAFLFVPPEQLNIDLYRYYENAKLIPMDQSIWVFIQVNFYFTFDFIYYIFFYLCNKFGLPYQLVTGLSVGLLYANTLTLIDLIQLKYEFKLTKSNDLLLRTFALLSVSSIMVLGISRNVTALMFLFFGVNSLVKGNKIKAVFFFLIAVFTHTSLLLYLSFIIFGYYWKGKFIKNITIRRTFIVLVTIIGLNSFLWINLVLLKPLESTFFFKAFSYYSNYLSAENYVNIFNSKIDRSNLLMIYTSTFILFYGLFFLRKYNPIIWVCYISYLWLVISLGFSHMFIQRTLLFLIPLQGIVASAFFAQKNKPLVKEIYRLLLIIGIVAFMLNVYGYRESWDFGFPNF